MSTRQQAVKASELQYGALILGVGIKDAWSWFDVLWVDGKRISEGAGQKALNECQEFVNNPCLEEAADVIISILGACDSKGWTLQQVGQAVIDKMKVNRSRIWEMQADGTYQHVKGN